MIEVCLKGWELIVEKNIFEQVSFNLQGDCKNDLPIWFQFFSIAQVFLNDFTIIVISSISTNGD